MLTVRRVFLGESVRDMRREGLTGGLGWNVSLNVGEDGGVMLLKGDWICPKRVKVV